MPEQKRAIIRPLPWDVSPGTQYQAATVEWNAGDFRHVPSALGWDTIPLRHSLRRQLVASLSEQPSKLGVPLDFGLSSFEGFLHSPRKAYLSFERKPRKIKSCRRSLFCLRGDERWAFSIPTPSTGRGAPGTKPTTRTLDLLRNHPWNMQAVITENGAGFYVRIEPIDGPLHGTEKTTAHKTRDEAYRHARTVLGMDEPGRLPSTTLADLEADSEDGFTNAKFATLRAALG